MDKLKVLYLSMDDVEKASVGMDQVISALEKVYRLKGQGQVEMPSKIGIHTRPNALIHAMPAYIPAVKSAGIACAGITQKVALVIEIIKDVRKDCFPSTEVEKVGRL